MATEENQEVPRAAPTEETLEEKMGDFSLNEKDLKKSDDSLAENSLTEVHESVMDELTSGTPKLHHVETVDTTDTRSGDSTDEQVVKAEVPAAFIEELESDHNIAPTENPTGHVETVAKEVGAEDGETAPATREVPVTITHEDVETKPSKIAMISDKLHKVFGKDTSS